MSREFPNDYGIPSIKEIEKADYISSKLMKQYPGYPWMVHVNGYGGIAIVQLDFSGNWGFILRLADLENDIELKSVMRAGGELLERFKLRRGQADEAQIYNMPVNFTGLPQPAL